MGQKSFFQKPLKKRYKNFSKEKKAELMDDIFYDHAQNLKMPFIDYIQLRNNLIIGLVILFYVYITDDKDMNTFSIFAESIKHFLITMGVLYYFTNKKTDELLENPV